MAHANEDLIRSMDAAQGRGDFPAMFSIFADDVVAHFAGRSKLAGDYKGKDQLQELFGRFMGAIGSIVNSETHDVIAGDAHGVMLHVVTAERGGQRIELRNIDLFHISGGKVTEAWFGSEDQYGADAWFDAGM